MSAFSQRACCRFGELTNGFAVYAVFGADVRIIDPVKRAALSQLLLQSVTSTAPGEKLDEKLAKLVLPSDIAHDRE